MPYAARVYQILIASPGDVAQERGALRQVVYSWNDVHSQATRSVVLPVMWESHALPRLGDRPQAIINRQLIQTAACDMLIGAFWTRSGTHTGVAESGTVEEIEQFITSGKPVMLYFSNKSVKLDRIDHEQHQRLEAFKTQVRSKGLYREYDNVQQLRGLVENHLTRTIRELGQNDAVAAEISFSDQQYRDYVRRLLGEHGAAWERAHRDQSVQGGRSALGFLASELNISYRDFETVTPELLERVATIATEVGALVGPIGEERTMPADFWDRGAGFLQQLHSIAR